MKIVSRFLYLLLLISFPLSGTCAAAERSGTVTFNININAPEDSRNVKLWFPYPTSDLDQTISDLRFSGNYSSFTISREPQSGALYLYTDWSAPAKKRSLSVTFHAKAKERRISRLVEAREPIPQEVRKYLEAEFWVPSDDSKIRSQARKITAGRKGILQKARAIYDWTIENTRRDPNIPGCGLGNARATLASRAGKCADISSVFVALARGAGVPAREVYGLRLGEPGQTDITDCQHCWAEFYLPGTGWVPVDPWFVMRIMFQKNLDLAAAKPYREYYFGSLDEYRITLEKGGRGLTFPEGNAEKVSYFMYPYAEVDGKPLDYCRPKTFHFTASFREN